MTRLLILLVPAIVLLSCSPRAYYRTLETEGSQGSVATELAPSRIQEATLDRPTATANQPAPSQPGLSGAQPTQPVSHSPMTGETGSVMSWDAFAATVLPKHAAFEAAWAEAEEQWADRLFSLRGTDPLFAPKGEFETEEDHQIRRGQALDAARKQRTSATMREPPIRPFPTMSAYIRMNRSPV